MATTKVKKIVDIEKDFFEKVQENQLSNINTLNSKIDKLSDKVDNNFKWLIGIMIGIATLNFSTTIHLNNKIDNTNNRLNNKIDNINNRVDNVKDNINQIQIDINNVNNKLDRIENLIKNKR